MNRPIDYVSSPVGMTMPAATPFTRLRAGIKPSPYNPQHTLEDWDNPSRMEFMGFLASTSSVVSPDANREETTSTAILTVPDPLVDIKKGDRILQADEPDRQWEVTGVPSRDQHPFTGWRPTCEISLTEWKG